MKLFFQKDMIIDCAKKLMRLLIRIKNFVLDPPPGYLEYKKAILSKDANFNYQENEYFKRHILPYMIKEQNLLKNGDYSSINYEELFNSNSSESFRINPATGLPMIGAHDAGGNLFGFNDNNSIHHHLNDHSSFHHMHTNSSFNSFDNWK